MFDEILEQVQVLEQALQTVQEAANAQQQQQQQWPEQEPPQLEVLPSTGAVETAMALLQEQQQPRPMMLLRQQQMQQQYQQMQLLTLQIQEQQHHQQLVQQVQQQHQAMLLQHQELMEQQQQIQPLILQLYPLTSLVQPPHRADLPQVQWPEQFLQVTKQILQTLQQDLSLNIAIWEQHRAMLQLHGQMLAVFQAHQEEQQQQQQQQQQQHPLHAPHAPVLAVEDVLSQLCTLSQHLTQLQGLWLSDNVLAGVGCGLQHMLQQSMPCIAVRPASNDWFWCTNFPIGSCLDAENPLEWWKFTPWNIL
jgi:hypothetical protein